MDPIAVKDLAGLSQPLDRLIDAISKGIGAIYEPKYIREIAKAEADAAIINAESEAKVSVIRAKTEAEKKAIEWQTSERLKFLEDRRQNNINNIVHNAVGQLPETVNNPNKVDEDWVTQFFNICQDIGNEEMQYLWGKLLADEVSNPGTFSLRTLYSFRLLNQYDARLFTIFCKFVWSDQYVMKHYEFDYLADHGLRDYELSHLEALSLIIKGRSWVYKPNEMHIFTYFNKKFVFKNNNDSKDVSLECHYLTKLGSELRQLCQVEPDEEYLSNLIELYKMKGIDISPF